jgi:hypothetical protein
MRDIFGFYRLLRPEQQKALEGVLEDRLMTLESFKLMRKDYSKVKSKVKQIEKKLVAIMEQADEKDYTGRWIMREVESIEKKYKDIEYAIKHYNQSMRMFNSFINSHHLSQYDFEQRQWGGPVSQLKSYLSSADGRINDALNAIRITERYFKNITSAFKGHASQMAYRKLAAERLRLNEIKLAEEQARLESNETNGIENNFSPSVPDLPE